MNHDINEEKTEQPTEHHIKKFRKKGETRYSRELNSLLILIFGLSNLWWSRYSIIFELKTIMFNSFNFNQNILTNQQNISLNFFFFIKKILIVFFPFFSFLICIIIIPPILFGGIKFNFTSLKLNFARLNLLHGLKKFFSFQIFIELFKTTLKLFIISCISIFYLWIYFYKILFLSTKNISSSLLDGFNVIFYCCILIILGLIPIVILDVFWRQWSYYKKLKMTHQEIKDEFKEREGSPQIKARIRQQMKINLRRRMISDVPKADVIITNPIHYAIALKYDIHKMNAPKVIAKGIGATAMKIQKIALKNGIAIIASPSLARALYRYSEIGQYIPGPLYKAVAEILAWVWKVKKWKREGGIFPEKPKNISVPSELNVTGESND
ncbi:flagellar biosynthesis protein FlhB [Buchnera aphidicola]|jgi:flagellar biosynthetic protein FlhB|uniref:Flagellar biosynthetic protein FlhB n=1 Tax=Buchnera aphidicola subsp. Schizaphis graminum (strain Sg) TaxID=198804 RepID=FLHB_BUCAP|nr:flagellar biosynthesis protein FlhB [Buchnera aphidicola]Q8K9S1.1 RecName: Full=Flagellar biosynthetic protein FlhB [Buchnera aphidicola str. Sg (Schizaphis graminum)]AAM67794.1 flagellar biosynthetic protein FlhB [Buchnera aphidicola str. Sg (Schizaphis graminum)]AWI49708.1 flagellar type III secretion system protein FlhB [Buchnera aphidicola (Schizaphis graminum)]